MNNWYQELKQEIIDHLQDLGIDKIGFASAEPFEDLRERMLKRREKGYESDLEERDIEKRVNPQLILENAQSIIAIVVAYPSKMESPPKSEPGAYRGTISRYAWGMDYVHVLQDRLARLENFIKERAPLAETVSMVDNGLSARAVAERAGIGWIGKNGFIITPEYGTWKYLGQMVTNLPFPPDQPIIDDCGDCTLCIDACPTSAIVSPGQLNAQRCLAYILQANVFLDDEMMTKIGNRLYGCDTCQVVCPKNNGKNWTRHLELQPDPELAKPLLKPLLRMNKKEFNERYKMNTMTLRRERPIQRNVIIALGNLKDRSAIPELTEVLFYDNRPELRAAAAWSLGKIGGKEAEKALETAKNREKLERVLDEVEKAYEKLYKSL